MCVCVWGAEREAGSPVEAAISLFPHSPSHSRSEKTVYESVAPGLFLCPFWASCSCSFFFFALDFFILIYLFLIFSLRTSFSVYYYQEGASNYVCTYIHTYIYMNSLM